MKGLVDDLFPPPPPSLFDEIEETPREDSPRVAVAISVFVDPDQRSRGLGDVCLCVRVAES